MRDLMDAQLSSDAADALIRFDPRLRCACKPERHERCIRKATAEDRLCDDCRDDLHGDQIRYVSTPALRDWPERVDAVLDARRGHAELIPVAVINWEADADG